jgi:hypothetical protein
VLLPLPLPSSSISAAAADDDDDDDVCEKKTKFIELSNENA